MFDLEMEVRAIIAADGSGSPTVAQLRVPVAAQRTCLCHLGTWVSKGERMPCLPAFFFV